MCQMLLLLFCVLVTVNSIPNTKTKPCRSKDDACITAMANGFLIKAIEGDPSKNIQSLDPIHHDYIHGKFAIIDYTLTNSTMVGFQKCHIAHAKLDMEKDSMDFKLRCPYLHIFGIYDASGLLIIVPIEGNGDYSFKTWDYHITIQTGTKIVEGQDGTTHLQFKNFQAIGDLKGGMEMDLKNLFNGQNDQLADAALKFANTYWKPVAKEFQGPIVNANIQKLIKNLNKYLKFVPLDTLLIS